MEGPQKIGKYEIMGMLGKGSSGLVYKGFDPFVRREVAVKTALHLVEEPKHLGGRDAPQHNFFTEARAAGMLNHPHIISLYDAGMEGDLCYIVMEYVDGDTLAPWARRLGPRMKLSQCVDMLTSCAEALAYSHQKGVLHRDIKPTNIMLMRDGTAKIMDFSIAEVMGGGVDNANHAVGSPLYMPPEQVMRKPLTPAADLYALGAVAYQMFTGEPPFMAAHLPGLFTAIRNQPAPDPRELRPDLPEQLALVTLKLLSKKPEQRYTSGDALAQDLVQIAGHLKLTEGKVGGRREGLRTLKFFQRFLAAETEELIAVSKFRTVAAGETIGANAYADACYYVLLQGQCLARRAGKPVLVLQVGDCFAEEGPRDRRQTVFTAASSILVLEVTPEALERLPLATQLRFYRTHNQLMLRRMTLGREQLAGAATTLV